MISLDADVTVLGSGFSGSLTALLLKRIGLRPVLLERGTHPRFALGESSTPIADFVLRRLASTYHLPRLIPLTHYGSWVRQYPQVIRGLKRGFSYFHHRAGELFEARPDHANELLVAASPNDEVADTHWFRADFDHFLVREVLAEGIPYFDHVTLEEVVPGESWRLSGRAGADGLTVRTRFIIDASGEGTVIAQRLGIPVTDDGFRTRSRALYGHFRGVKRWDEVLAARGGRLEDHPFPCDAAALHHVFDGGWMWVLRFDHGVTSAGFCLDPQAFPLDESVTPEDEWRRFLKRFPSIAAQFSEAAVVPGCGFFRTGRLQRRARSLVGENWAMLPATACRLDALHSTGNAHALCGVERLIGAIEKSWGRPELFAELQQYERAVLAELDLMDELVHGTYLGFRRFELMVDFAMHYFAAATMSEHRRRAGLWTPHDAFLLAHDEAFRARARQAHAEISELASQEKNPPAMAEFRARVARQLAPYNVAGLCDPSKRNMYAYEHPGA